jgi:hypothetical protein
VGDADLSKVTEADLGREIESLKNSAARALDPCLTAKFIALSDQRVSALFLKKLQDGYLFEGINCLDLSSIPENSYVYFDFDCKPGTLCFVRPAFLVVVNIVAGCVVAIVDPYVPSSFGAMDTYGTAILKGCNNCRKFFPKYKALKDWLRKARDAGQFSSEAGCELFVNDTTTAAGIIAELLGGGIPAAVIEEALRQCGKCACKDIY